VVVDSGWGSVSKGGGRDRGTAWVGISGRENLTWCLAEQSGEEGPTIPLVGLLHPVSQMVTAGTGERYRRMFGRSFRRHRRGFDWVHRRQPDGERAARGAGPLALYRVPGPGASTQRSNKDLSAPLGASQRRR
jgi:hypothetical protein